MAVLPDRDETIAWKHPSLPFLLTTVDHLSWRVWAELRLTPGNSISSSFIPCICDLRPVLKGVEEETKDKTGMEKFGQLFCVAIECTVIRLHHSVPLSPGYNLENKHCN